MPLYEYQCTKCNERTEILQKLNDPPYTHCPKCGGEVKKLFSSPAIQFKGSGFYKTDYATTSTAKPSEKSEKSEKAEAKSETKSETKSESKSESGTSDAKTEKKTSE
jgi:putative FmdB family regulatory protein